MGINRIRLQDGAMVDPRMQQTYQQNIAANQAQQARNEGIFQASASRLFPEGNFQQIKTNAPTQKDYNIRATEDLVKQLPGGAVRDVLAPAAAAILSVPYDVIQGIGRAVDKSDVDTSPYAGIVDDTEIPRGPSLLDLGQAIDAENPLSSAMERTIGAAGPLAERISGMDLGMSQAAAATPTQDDYYAQNESAIRSGMMPAQRPTMADVAGAVKTDPRAGIKEAFLSERMSGGPSRDQLFTSVVPDFDRYGTYTGDDQLIKDYAAAGRGTTQSQLVKLPANHPYADSGPGYYEYDGTNFSKTADLNMTPEYEKFIRSNYGLASGGRVGFQAGSTEEMAEAQAAAAQDPELDRIRKQLFGEGYVQDIGKGEGIAQYYSGFGLPQSLIFTPPVEEITPAVDITQPVVDTGDGGGGGGDGGVTGITSASAVQPTSDPFLMSGAAGEARLPPTSDPFLMSGAAGGASLEDIDLDQVDLGNPTGDSRIQPEEFGLVPDLVNTVDYSELDDLEADPGAQPIDFQTLEQTNAINEAFNKVKDLGEAGVGKLKDSLVALGGKVKEGFDNTIEIGGKTIDLTKSLIGGAISLATNVPGVGLLLNAAQPDKYDQEAQGALGEIGMLKTTEGGLTVDKYGKNVQSMFGDYDDYNLERQIDLQEKIDDGTIQQYDEDGNLTYLGQELEDRKEIEQKLNKTRLGEAQQEQQDYVQEIEQQQAVNTNTQSGRDEADRQQRNTGVATVETDQGTRYETSSGDTYASAAEAAEKGDGGGSGGGGKIVCTMMNDSYGFGSFRNKIWLRHSKDLAPEYQIGYHKIFLPLVRLSKTNKLLKKTLEHIAVHRTIDIRQEARGKKHLLGRVYRKILEPICYMVGKYAKR